MADQKVVLRAVAEEAQPIPAPELARKLAITQEETRAALSKLKNKAYVRRDGEAWVATDAGREVAETGVEIPTTIADVGADAKTRLEYYGKIAGAKPDMIVAVVELMTSGDPYDLEHMNNVFARLNVPIECRRTWLEMWSNYVIRNAPPEQREKAKAVVQQEIAQGGLLATPAAPAAGAESGIDYILVDDDPVWVGKGRGHLTREEAVALSMTRAARGARGGQGQGNQGNQGFTAEDILNIIDRINEKRGNTTPPKAYVATQTPEGVKVQEVEAGQPIVVGAPTPPPANPPPQPKTFLVNEEGEVQEIQSGQPIILRSPAGAASSTWLVDRNTAEVKELKPGEPIVLKPAESQSTMFPVFRDEKGKPVYMDSRTLEPYITWERFRKDEQRKDQFHDAAVGVMERVQENVGKVAGAIDRMMKEEAGETATPGNSAAEEAAGSVITVECPACHQTKRVPEGTQQFVCTNCDEIVELEGE